MTDEPADQPEGADDRRREASRDTVLGFLMVIYAAISLAAGLAHALGPRAIRVKLVELGVDPAAIVVPPSIMEQATWSAISGAALAIMLAVGAFGLFASAGWARTVIRWWAVLALLQTLILLFAAYASIDGAAEFQYQVQELQREALVAAGEEIPPGFLDRTPEAIRDGGARRLATVGFLPMIVPALSLLIFRRTGR